MPNSVSSSFTELPTEIPACDAWGHINPGNASIAPTVVDGSGISVSRKSAGYLGVSFSNPSQFGGGGYVVLTTAEVAGVGLPRMVATDRWVANASGTTGAGRTHGVELTTWTFLESNGNAGGTAALSDFGADELRVNFAAFALKTDTDMYNPEVKKLTYTDMTLWANPQYLSAVVSDNGEFNQFTPVGTTAYKFTPGAVYSYSAPVISVGTTPHPGRSYVANFYAKTGNTGDLRVLLGTLSDASSRYFVTLNLNGETGSAAHTTPSGPAIRTIHTSTGTNPEANNTIRVEDAGNGWREVTITHTPTTNTTSNLYLYFDLSTISLDPVPFVYIGGVQVEPGRTPTPYVELGNSAPVRGVQDAKKRLVPVIGGFGLTGSTYSTQMPNLLSKKSATAYGTVVIPPDASIVGGSTNPTYAYLEQSHNIAGVCFDSSFTNGMEFCISFDKPMSNTDYCVILSTEEEPENANPDWTTASEYSIPVVNRGSVYGELKRAESFHVALYRQTNSSVNWAQRVDQTARGLRTKIHFMVFGGGVNDQP